MSVVRLISRILLVAAAVSALAAAALLFSFRHFSAAPDSLSAIELPAAEDGSHIFEVKAGESADSVGRRLMEAGLIRSRLLWSAIARLDSERVKTGTYGIKRGADLLEIREVLVSGKQLLVRVTVPEGFTLKKIAEIMGERGIAEPVDFLSAANDTVFLRSLGITGPSAEGYLFPDTYFFPRSYPPRAVIGEMVNNFRSRIRLVLPKGLESYGEKELEERLTLASIVEREYRVADEAPLMAGVFLNRLRIGMALQSCATVEYIITEIQGRPHPEVLYNRDIAIRDPYNTYIKPGLPPGPISSPGLVALEAAFNPQASDFLYFRLVDANAGRHSFSRSLDEHIKAGVIYLKSFKAGS